mgnify:CR=1 FL=1
MHYQIKRNGEVIESGSVLPSVRLLSFLQSLSHKLEEGDVFQSKSLAAMYTGYGTWSAISSDIVKFQEMRLNLRTISTLRRRGATLSKITKSTERNFIKEYGRKITTDVKEGLRLVGKTFAEGPSTTIAQ